MSNLIAPTLAALHNALIVGGSLDRLWQQIPSTPEAVQFANELHDVLVQAQVALEQKE